MGLNSHENDRYIAKKKNGKFNVDSFIEMLHNVIEALHSTLIENGIRMLIEWNCMLNVRTYMYIHIYKTAATTKIVV